jgi:hypothetical protein
MGNERGEAYLTRVDAILAAVAHANHISFDDLVFSGETSRGPAVPFLLVGLFGQIIMRFFLSLGTTAGVWTSVALANSLSLGNLTDWHSKYFGKTPTSEQPRMKMYVPGRN